MNKKEKRLQAYECLQEVLNELVYGNLGGWHHDILENLDESHKKEVETYVEVGEEMLRSVDTIVDELRDEFEE